MYNTYEYKPTIMEKISDFIFDSPALAGGLVVLFSVVALFSVSCIHLNTGEKQYTGYIYSAEDGIAKTVGHLRFSETAGMDKQPSFCVDKRDGKQVKDLAGSGKKVKVIVPAGFAISFPWTCPIPANIELMEAE